MKIDIRITVFKSAIFGEFQKNTLLHVCKIIDDDSSKYIVRFFNNVYLWDTVGEPWRLVREKHIWRLFQCDWISVTSFLCRNWNDV